MRYDMKKLLLWTIVPIGILGSFLHFAYELSGDLWWVAPFAAVNESVWEHAKLAFWPMLIGALIVYGTQKPSPHPYFCAVSAGLYTAVGVIIAGFYTYTGIFGGHHLIVDILLFFVAVACGQWVIAKRVEMKPLLPQWVCMGLIALLAAMFIVFSLTPPQIPLFEDPLTGTFGIL